MSIEKVKAYFRKHGMEEKIQEFDVSSATVELAAAALNCEPQRIAKTLSFMVDKCALLVVAAGDAKIDNRKYKAQFGANDGVKVYLDVSLKRFETVFPACGSSNSAIELTIPQMEQYSGYAEWVDVCKGYEDAGTGSGQQPDSGRQ